LIRGSKYLLRAVNPRAVRHGADAQRPTAATGFGVTVKLATDVPIVRVTIRVSLWSAVRVSAASRCSRDGSGSAARSQ